MERESRAVTEAAERATRPVRTGRRVGRPPADPEVKASGRQIHTTNREWTKYRAEARDMGRKRGEHWSVSRLFRHRAEQWATARPGPDCARSVDRGDEGDLRPHNVYATRSQWREYDQWAAEQGVSRSQFIRALMAGPEAWK